MDPMWGRSGPSMDPYKDLYGCVCGGASGLVAGRHGSVETENGALALVANVFYIQQSIFHLKYV